MIDWDGLVNGPCQDAFGDPTIVFTPAAAVTDTDGGAVTDQSGAPLLGAVTSMVISGVFDRAYLQQQPMGGGAQAAPRAGASGNIVGLHPVLGVRLAQFQTPPRKADKIAIPSQGLSFTVQEVRPDGKGWALLILTKA